MPGGVMSRPWREWELRVVLAELYRRVGVDWFQASDVGGLMSGQQYRALWVRKYLNRSPRREHIGPRNGLVYRWQMTELAIRYALMAEPQGERDYIPERGQ